MRFQGDVMIIRIRWYACHKPLSTLFICSSDAKISDILYHFSFLLLLLYGSDSLQVSMKNGVIEYVLLYWCIYSLVHVNLKLVHDSLVKQ